MNRFFLYLLLILPIALALGFDVYYYYEHQAEGIKFSDLGWIWKTYHPSSHEYLISYVGRENWERYFAPLLSLKAVVAGAILTGTIVLVMILSKSLASINRKKTSAPKKNKGGLGRARPDSKRFVYKRK